MQLRHHILLASLAITLMAPTVHAQTPGVSGEDLISDCKGYPDSPRPRTCALFASSFAEFARSNDKTENPRGRLCIGEDVPVGEIIGLINDWLAKHPNAGSMNGYEIAHSATRDRYRCK